MASFAYGSVSLPFRSPNAVPRDAPAETQYLARHGMLPRPASATSSYQSMKFSRSQAEAELAQLQSEYQSIMEMKQRRQQSHHQGYNDSEDHATFSNSSFHANSQNSQQRPRTAHVARGEYDETNTFDSTINIESVDAQIPEHPAIRDPFAPSRDNPLLTNEMVQLVAKTEKRVSRPQRFTDASIYRYPNKHSHPSYKTTSSVYGSQPPRNVELPSAYYAVTSAFSKTFLTGPYRNSSFCTSTASSSASIAAAAAARAGTGTKSSKSNTQQM